MPRPLGQVLKPSAVDTQRAAAPSNEPWEIVKYKTYQRFKLIVITDQEVEAQINTFLLEEAPSTLCYLD